MTFCSLLQMLKFERETQFFHSRSLGEEKVHGFAVNIDYDKEEPLISCVNKDVLHAAYLLVNKNVKMYNELFKNPPFPAWKDGLNEVWN